MPSIMPISQCCGFGIFIPDPIRIFSVPDLGTRSSDPGSNNNRKEDGEKLVVLFFCILKFHNIEEK
jgi:hypothetical protein